MLAGSIVQTAVILKMYHARVCLRPSPSHALCRPLPDTLRSFAVQPPGSALQVEGLSLSSESVVLTMFARAPALKLSIP